jgi:release factor glutamine methyltransferase
LRIKDVVSKAEGISWLEAVNIVSFALSIRKEETLARFDVQIDDDIALQIKTLFEQRSQGRPLAYITGQKEFFSETFLVDESVLIPRPETELLVEEALGILEKNPRMADIVDMGTGSGAIGVIIAKRAQRKVLCIDMSLQALRVARQNWVGVGAPEAARFVCSDLFGGISKKAAFDMVLANLPYVPNDEWEGLAPDIREHEPRTALDGGEGGTETYRRFVAALPGHVKPEGCVLLEIDGSVQAEEVSGALRSAGFRVAVRKDHSNKERVLIGSWTNSS